MNVSRRRSTLPDGRAVALDDTTMSRVRVAVICLDEVAVREEPAVWAETEAFARELRAKYAGRPPSEIPGLQEARDLYKSFGMDPSRHRPSSEALLRRVLNDKGLYRLNNAVDCCNLASLTYLLPIGLYDRDLVVGDIVVRTGRPGEEYPGIRKDAVHLGGRLGLFDQVGGFGSPTSDSARTAVTAATVRILAAIFATGAFPPSRLADHAAHFASLFARYCDACPSYTDTLGG